MDSSNTRCSSDWESELDAVRQFLLSNDCPFPSHHIGVVAALDGIENERKRRFRDSKLQQKFMASSSSTLEGDYYEIDVMKMDKTRTTNPPNAASSGLTQPTPHENIDNKIQVNSEIKNSTMTDDWEDVTEDDVMITAATLTSNENNDDATVTESATVIIEDEMTKLTKRVVSTLADHNLTCSSPISALAVACHIVLVGTGNYICTGIPDDDTDGGGFAPPIRDLPVGQLLPSQWEDHVTHTNQVRLRYRKIGYGTFILSVLHQDTTSDAVICVTLESNINKDTEQQNPLRITMVDHINILSWDTAKKSSSCMKISPVLHYKGLGIFLRKFTEHFHLSITTKTNESNVPSFDHFASHYANAGAIKDIPTPRILSSSSIACGDPSAFPTLPQHPSSLPDILTATGRANHNSNNHQFPDGPGQFDDDLYPSGIPKPSRSTGGIGIPGNLMGPDHPMFNIRFGEGHDVNIHDSNSNHFGIPGMTPRFDPFGPPGGPTEPPFPPNNNNKKVPRGGPGNPNNDLAMPPPFGGNNNHNMFL